MEKRQNIKKILNTGLGVVALMGLVACACPIEIIPTVAVTNIQIDGNNPLSTLTNSRGPLTATVTPNNHTEGDVEWTSDNTDVVTVSNTGPTNATYTAKSITGQATITARVGGEMDTLTITVTISNIPATSIEINNGSNTIETTNGGRGPLTAVVMPSNHNDGNLQWSSDNPDVVTVSKTGTNTATFTARATGSANVTARVGSVMDLITIQVNLSATNIEIQGEGPLCITPDKTGTLNARATPEGHTDGDIIWSSSDEGIVTIGSNSGEYRGVAEGSAIITAEVGTGSVMDTLTIIVSNKVDGDGNGLIEILDLTMLHNLRYNLAGTSYKVSNGDVGDTSGCPSEGCNGYELVSDLSFDANGNDRTWSGNADDGYTLDSGDNNSVYFNVSRGGWEPVGDDSTPFTAIFDGGGFIITGLATSKKGIYFGLFGYTSNAQIRNLGLMNNLADYTENDPGIYIGGLVGFQQNSSIFACYATGNADGGEGKSDWVGGLVGFQTNSSIFASYATGPVDGGAGDEDYVGGLVGNQLDGSIFASYATGPVDGGAGGGDSVGGLVGNQKGNNIFACYATGDVDGGSGSDTVGKLVGNELNTNGTASYGFGSVVNGTTNLGTDGSPPVTHAVLLTLSNAGSIWSNAASGTAGAWDFGDNTIAPRLLYNDYDGSGSMFGCSGRPIILLPSCGSVIPGQN